MSVDVLPLWAVFAVTILAVVGSVEAGYRFGRYRQVSTKPENEGPVNAIAAATLALLAFLLTFTFGLAAARFENRRAVVREEANAIGTASLRAGLLPEPQRAVSRQLLREYVDVRLLILQRDQIPAAIAKSESLHKQLWSEATKAAELDSKSIPTGLYIQSLNEVIDSHGKRVAAGLRSRIPITIWAVLYGVTVLAMAATGYQEGLTSRIRSPAILALILAFSSVTTLIADLDRPHEGFLSVSQQSIVDLQEAMRSEHNADVRTAPNRSR